MTKCTKTKSETDEAITKLLDFLTFIVSTQNSVSLRDFFKSEGRQALLDKISFNPTQSYSHGVYDLFLTYKVSSDYKNYNDDPFYIDLKDIILDLAGKGTSVESNPDLIGEMREISEDFLSRIISNEYSKDDVLKHAYLVCSALRCTSYSYEEEILKKDLQCFTIHALALTPGIGGRECLYSTLLELGNELDTYEKLNALFLPVVENIYSCISNKNKSSPALKVIK